jgi:hypothetical protein
MAGVTLGRAVLVPSMVANCRSAVSWASPIGWNGAAGLGFWSAAIRSWAACVAALAEESLGILSLLGKNSTVSAIQYDRVLVT